MDKNFMNRAFLIILVIASLTACFFIFRPFLSEILIAAIFATIFYKPYEWLAKKLGNRRKISAFIMCLLAVLVIIIPLANLILFGAREAVVAYSQTTDFFNRTDWNGIVQNIHINGVPLSGEKIQTLGLDLVQKLTNWLVSGATSIITSTTSFAISLLFILLAMFFFFLDGKRMLEKIMYWTPLPNKYDKEIFKKFQNVSLSFLLSILAVAIAQGIVCGIGFLIVDLVFGLSLPAFFAGLGAAFFSFLPLFGAGLVWLPTAIYLMFMGNLFAGIFLILWGFLLVSTIDNIVRPLILRKNIGINPVLVMFAIFGGISLFGFWGIAIGPLIVSVTIAIMHIYETEYKNVLEK